MQCAQLLYPTFFTLFYHYMTFTFFNFSTHLSPVNHLIIRTRSFPSPVHTHPKGQTRPQCFVHVPLTTKLQLLVLHIKNRRQWGARTHITFYSTCRSSLNWLGTCTGPLLCSKVFTLKQVGGASFLSGYFQLLGRYSVLNRSPSQRYGQEAFSSMIQD